MLGNGGQIDVVKLAVLLEDCLIIKNEMLGDAR